LLIEIERSTKSLKAVMAKIEQYVKLFSPWGEIRDQSAYRDKYPDKLAPVVVFAFDSQERADNVAALVQKRRVAQNFYIPELVTGTHEEAATFIRGHLKIRAVPRSPNDVLTEHLGPFVGEVRQFAEHIMFTGYVSSRYWPPNWREVMRRLYTEQHWAKLEAELRERQARSLRAQEQEQQRDLKANIQGPRPGAAG
jgi:hypothetical protein